MVVALSSQRQVRFYSSKDLIISKPGEIQAIAAARDDGVEVWVANLTDQKKALFRL